MKKITFLMMLVVSMGFSQVTIGTGDDGGAFESPPLNPYYGTSYGQSIYLASEINATGNITSVDFQLNPGSVIDAADEMVDVWIGHTTKASFDSVSDWVDVATLTQVLTSGTITSAGDVLTITFDSAFTYNGSDNLIIAVDANETGFNGFGDSVLATDGPTANMSLMHRSDSVNNDPTAPVDGLLFQSRGNITFMGITAVCTPAVATALLVEDCGNSQFSILVDVTDLGDSVNLEITNDAGVASTTVMATGEVTIGPFPIETAVVLTLENENDDMCDVALDAIIDLCPVGTNTLDYYNLQWPATLAFPENEMTDQFVYAQVYEAGLTDTTMGSAAAGIEAWVGYSSDDTDPSGTGWTWEVATFNAEVGNNDEYVVDMQDLGLDEGTYYYASRFTLNAGPFMYGGILSDGSNGGIWDGTTNISGVLTVEAHLPLPGDDCENPIYLMTLPYNTTDNTSLYLDDYSGSPGATNCGTTSSYLNGDDVVYAYTATADGTINVAMSAIGSAYSGLFVYTDCANIGTECVAGHGNSNSTDDYDINVSVTNGTTYYIVISTWASPQSTTYTLDITEVLCAEPTALTAFTTSLETADISWIAGGTETLWDFELVDITAGGTAIGTPTITGVTNPSYSLTGLTAENDYEIYVRADCGSDDLSQWVGPIAFRTGYCIPEGTSTETYIDSFSTTGGVLINISNLSSGLATNNYEDNTSTMAVSGAADSTFDFLAEIVSGTAGFAVWVDWNNDLNFDVSEVSFSTTAYGDGPFTGSVTIPNGTADGDYRMRIMLDWNDGNPGDDAPCSFGSTTTPRGEVEDYTVTVDAALSTTQFENEAAFTYYPNPVKNTLTLNAQNTIEQVAMYNMLGQEVLRATPNTVTSNLDMSNLQTGTYFVKVTIANFTETIRVIKQ